MFSLEKVFYRFLPAVKVIGTLFSVKAVGFMEKPWAMEKGHGPASPYWPRLSTQESEGPEHTKAVMIRTKTLKYIYRLYEKDELYDLAEDPQELDNRIEDPRYQEEIVKLKLRMLDFMIETGDWVPDRKDIR